MVWRSVFREGGKEGGRCPVFQERKEKEIEGRRFKRRTGDRARRTQ